MTASQMTLSTAPSATFSAESRTRIAATLKLLRRHFPAPERTADDWAGLLKDYLAVLARHDPRHVEEAAQDYLVAPDSRFFPKVGQLLALIDRRARDRASIAKTVASEAPPPWKPDPNDFSPDFCARAEADLAGMEPGPLRDSLAKLLATCRETTQQPRRRRRPWAV